ncbi:MAG: AsmA family protein [Spirochaetota bacterium]|nr:AsmA family protein [Spirochaetota bacterium]
MKKGKVFKYISIIFLSVIFLIVLGSALIIYYFPKDKLLQIITIKAEDSLTRKVEIGGLNYNYRGLILNDLSIYNGLSDEDEILAVAQTAIIRFSLLPLLQRQLDINKIIINQLKLNLIYNNGKFNLQNLIGDLKDNQGESSISTTISSISLRDTEITLQNPPKRLKPLEGRYILHGTIEMEGKREFRISDCNIILPENRGRLSSDMRLALFDDDFELLGDVKLYNCSLKWVYQWNRGIPLPYNDFSGKIKRLKITKKSVNGYVIGKSSIAKSDITLNANGACSVKIPEKRVLISDIKASTKNSNINISEILLSFKGKLLKLRVAGNDILINDLKPFIKILPAELNGRVSADFYRLNEIYNGKFNLKNVIYKAGLLSDINANILIKNNTFQNEDVPLKLWKQPCKASIATTDGNFKKIFLNLHSEEINLKRMRGNRKGTRYSKINLPFEINGKITIDNLTYNMYQLSNLSLNYSLLNNDLSLNKLYSQFAQGNINGKGIVYLSRSIPSLKISTTFDSMKLQNMSRYYEKLNNKFFGVLNGSANLECRIEENMNILNSLSGEMEFFIEKGKIVDTGIQEGLGMWLSELKYKLRDLEFNKIYGNCKILGSNLYINSFIFNAPHIRLNVSGYFNRKLAGSTKILLEFTPDFVQDLPNPAFFLQLRKYRQGNWYIIPFESTGENIADSRSIKRL